MSSSAAAPGDPSKDFPSFRTHLARLREGGATGLPSSDLLELSRYWNNGLFQKAHLDPSSTPFHCGGSQIGLVGGHLKEELLANHPDVFLQQKDGSGRPIIALRPELTSHSSRSEALDRCLRSVRDRDSGLGRFPTLRGWRDECYEVRAPEGGFAAEPLFRMERAATCLFGLVQYGVDINGYVLDEETGKVSLWMQKRAATKQTWPGKWDNFVGGGLSCGFGVRETAVKEALEEANVTGEVAAAMLPAGTVSFLFRSPRGLFPNVEFVHDLRLPPDFTPGNNDGEVDEFKLVPQDEVLDLLLSDEMKTTSAPIAVDFLVRRGVINTQNEANLPELIENLHLPVHRIYFPRLVNE